MMGYASLTIRRKTSKPLLFPAAMVFIFLCGRRKRYEHIFLAGREVHFILVETVHLLVSPLCALKHTFLCERRLLGAAPLNLSSPSRSMQSSATQLPSWEVIDRGFLHPGELGRVFLSSCQVGRALRKSLLDLLRKAFKLHIPPFCVLLHLCGILAPWSLACCSGCLG